MNETIPPHNDTDYGKSVIIATTIVLMTCILSCAAVPIILIMRTA